MKTVMSNVVVVMAQEVTMPAWMAAMFMIVMYSDAADAREDGARQRDGDSGYERTTTGTGSGEDGRHECNDHGLYRIHSMPWIPLNLRCWPIQWSF